jgi:hypothetical protein
MSDHQSKCKYCLKDIALKAPRWAAREPDEYWHYSCAQLTTGEQYRAVDDTPSL